MKVLLEIVGQQTNVGVILDELRQKVKNLNKELSQPGAGAQRTRELREEIVKTKNEIAKTTEEQRRLNREFKATQVPKDSLAGLRLEYQRLVEQIGKLSKAERESQVGQGLIKSAAGVKSQVDQIEQSVGRFTGNVGNYKSALLGVGDLLTGGLATGGVVIGVQKLFEVMKIGTEQALAYEQALDDLSALTGVTGSALDGLEATAKSLQSINVQGVEITNTGTEILNAFKLVGGARPELLQDADAMGEVAKNAIILSKASGDALEPSVDALTTTLGQFNLAASESPRLINELAAGAKEGASEIPQTTKALKEFGTVAKIANVSTGESIALIQLLASRQLKGAEAGTQLRNVLAKLASADILPRTAQAAFERLGINVNVLKDATLPLETRLKELGKAQGDVSALTKIFGLENLQAATIITSNLGQYDALKGKIEGTNEAMKQAEIRADNTNNALLNLKNKGLNALTEAFSKGTPVIEGFSGALGFLVSKTPAVELLLNALTGISAASNAIAGASSGIRGGASLRLGGAVQATGENPLVQFGEFFDVIDPATKGLDQLTQNITAAAEKQQALSAALGEGADKTGDVKDSADAAAGSVAFLQKQVQRLQDELNRTAPTDRGFALLVAQLEASKAALDSVQKSIERIRNAGRVRAAAPFAPGADTSAAPDLGFVPSDFAASEKAAADKRREEAEKQRKQDLIDEQEYQNRLFQINKEAAEKEQRLREETQEKEEKDNKSRRERNRDIAIETGAAIAQAVLDIEKNRLDRQTNEALSSLDAEYEKRIELAQGNADLQDKLRKEQEKKRLELERQAAKERQKIAIKEALIQGALSALKGFFTAGLAGVIEAAALTLANIAVIKSQSFARGGMVKFGQFGGQPHTAGGTKGVFSDGTRVEVEKDEIFAVVNKHNAPMLRHLSAVNSAGGHGKRFFAAGGALDFTPQIALPRGSGSSVQVQAQAGFSDDQVKQIGGVIGKMVAAEVAAQIQPALANGLNDANRRNDREKALKTNQTV